MEESSSPRFVSSEELETPEAELISPETIEPDPNTIANRNKWSYGSTIEPMLFLHILGYSSSFVVIQNLYIDTLCYDVYGQDSTIDCSNLSSNTTADAVVQGIASRYSTYRSLIDSGIPVLFSLFIGPWSDKHGSKPMMLLPLLGYISSATLFYFFSYINYPDPAILLLASVPIGLTGGMISFALSAFRYVAGASSAENRSLHMAMAQGAWFLALPIGIRGGAAMLNIGGYKLVFGISIICSSASFLYTILFVKSDKPEEYSHSHILKDMFNLAEVKATFQTAFKPRAGSKRLWLWLLLGTIYLMLFTLYGTGTVAFLYTQRKFHWDVSTYSTYSTFDALISTIGITLVALTGMKYLQIRDTTIGVFSAMGYLGGTIIWLTSSFTTAGWLMYLGACVQMFSGLITTVGRSMLSKLCPLDEVGKVYSFLASGEAIISLVTTPIYNFIYSQTVEDFPGAVFILNCSLNFILVLLFIYLATSAWNSTVNSTMNANNDNISDSTN